MKMMNGLMKTWVCAGAIMACMGIGYGATSTWTFPGTNPATAYSSAWGNGSAWSGGVPNVAGAVADFTQAAYVGTSMTIYLADSDYTVGTILFGHKKAQDEGTTPVNVTLRTSSSTGGTNTGVLTFDNLGSEARFAFWGRGATVGASPSNASRKPLTVKLNDSLVIENNSHGTAIGGADVGGLTMHLQISAGTAGLKTIRTAASSTSSGTITFPAAFNDGSATNWSAISDGVGTVAIKHEAGSELQLLGVNTYSGGTEITNGGTIKIGNQDNPTGSALGSGSVNVLADGKIKGVGRIAPGAGNNIVFSGNGVLTPGGGNMTLALSGSSKLVMSTSAIIEMSVGTVTDKILFETAGDWISGTTLNLNIVQGTGFDIGIINDLVLFEGLTTQGIVWNVTGLEALGYTGEMTWSGSAWELNAVAVPEASTYAVLLGLAVLAGVMARRRRG